MEPSDISLPLSSWKRKTVSKYLPKSCHNLNEIFIYCISYYEVEFLSLFTKRSEKLSHIIQKVYNKVLFLSAIIDL